MYPRRVPRRARKAAACALLLALLPVPANALDAAGLRSVLVRESRLLGPAAGAYVRDLDSGATLFANRADLTLAPASNEKLLVTAAALLRLGPTTTLPTAVLGASAPVDGRVDGDLALVGGGDPFLTSARVKELAARLVDLGVERVPGGILADATLLDRRVGSFDSGWRYDRDLGGSLGALVVGGGRGDDPALHAARVLHDALRHAHVQIGRLPRRGTLGGGAVPLASAQSSPLGSLVAAINVPSDNFAAELLLKVLGARIGAAGTTFAGAAVVRSTLAPLGVRPTVFDGSGLSRADRVSARQLVALLTRMASGPDAAAFAASLPVAGRSGTLVHRMRRTAAHDRCRAKTGTLIGVSALSGYCTTTAGAKVTFSFLENRVCASCAKRIEDRMTAAIARYGR